MTGNRISWAVRRRELFRKVQVNLPFSMLIENLDGILEIGLQPELYFSGAALDLLSWKEVERATRKLQLHNIPVTFHAPFLDLNAGAVDERVRELSLFRFNQVMELVPHFHPQAIVFHPGYDRWRFDHDVDLWLEKSLLTWRPLVEKAEALGVKVAVENVFEENPSILKRLLERMDSPFLGYCLDVGHGHLFSEVALLEWVETLGAWLVEMHLHDNHRQADDHLPLGQGNIDFPSIFHKLREKDLHPIYTLEPHGKEHLDASLKAIERYL